MEDQKKEYEIKDFINQLAITIEKLDAGEITLQKAIAISKLHNSMQGWFNYELRENLLPVVLSSLKDPLKIDK